TAAQAHAGEEYQVLQWSGPCPHGWVDELAVLRTRMSTDAPLGGLDLADEVWDAARVRADERGLAERGMSWIVTAAAHRPSQTLVAYTAFQVRDDPEGFVDQWDTLVRREHR